MRHLLHSGVFSTPSIKSQLLALFNTCGSYYDFLPSLMPAYMRFYHRFLTSLWNVRPKFDIIYEMGYHDRYALLQLSPRYPPQLALIREAISLKFLLVLTPRQGFGIRVPLIPLFLLS